MKFVFYNIDGEPASWCRLEKDGTCSFRADVRLKDLRKFCKKYRIIRYYPVVSNRLTTFFSFIGRQNDYMYPPKGSECPECYPFSKPHLWKTRMGFKTSWELAGIIHCKSVKYKR